jgi:undecaprenyl-diphosphatase
MLESPMIVAWALIAGGVAILVVERTVTPGDDKGVADLPIRQALGVGLAQCLALVPGVSRSGATIMGALALGVGRKTAAEFSFFLAIPTMLGASALSLMDKRQELAGGVGVGWSEVAIGFVVAFVVALIVIRVFVAYVSRRGFALFAWYRIALGTAAVTWLALR